MGKNINGVFISSHNSDLIGLMWYSRLVTNAIPRVQRLRFVPNTRTRHSFSTLLIAKDKIYDIKKKPASTQIIIGYVVAALSGMALIAHFKGDKDFDPEVVPHQ